MCLDQFIRIHVFDGQRIFVGGLPRRAWVIDGDDTVRRIATWQAGFGMLVFATCLAVANDLRLWYTLALVAVLFVADFLLIGHLTRDLVPVALPQRSNLSLWRRVEAPGHATLFALGLLAGMAGSGLRGVLFETSPRTFSLVSLIGGGAGGALALWYAARRTPLAHYDPVSDSLRS